MSNIRKMANLYKDAILKEFPQYGCSLTDRGGLMEEVMGGDYCILRVHQTSSTIIIIATFLSSNVNIKYKDHNEFIDYADPRFTEDIFSDIIKAYDKLNYTDKEKWHR